MEGHFCQAKENPRRLTAAGRAAIARGGSDRVCANMSSQAKSVHLHAVHEPADLQEPPGAPP